MTRFLLRAVCLVLVVLFFGFAPAEPTSLSLDGTVSIPRAINYQGRLTDEAGKPVSGTRDMVFRFYAERVGGTPVWEEGQAGVTVADGLFNVILGSANPITSLPAGPECWLEVVVQGQVISPRVRLVSVPYAFGADDAANLGSVPAASYVRSGTPAGGDLAGTYPAPQLAAGTIVDADVSALAGISDTKLAGTGTLVTNFNADKLDGFHAAELTAGVGISKVVRGTVDGDMSSTVTANLSSPVDPTKSVVLLRAAWITSGAANMGCDPQVYLANLTDTQITIGFGYNWNGNVGNVRTRVSYQVIEYR